MKRVMVSRIVSIVMPANPAKSSVFLPAASTSTEEMIVITTFMLPIAIVPISDAVALRLASLKISVE